MTRRDAVRLAVLSALAAPLLAACGDERGAGGGSAGTTDLELVSSDVARSGGAPEAIPEVVGALHRLAGGLYRELATGVGNLVLSPYSIAVALGMTLPGAGGRTAAEMREVLGVRDDARFHGGMNALTSYVEGLAGPQERADGSKAEIALDAANQLFGQHDVAWERDFLDVLGREYGAGLRTVDYRTAAEQARVLINEWVAGRTNDRIPELIPDGVLDDMTRLVLVNALYLKAPWEMPFEKGLTAPMPFHRGDGGAVDVDTMVQPLVSGTLARGDGWQAARLPYAGGALAMTVVLPDTGRLADVERDVGSGELPVMLSAGRPVNLDVRLPKWEFRTQAGLNEILAGLGMPTAFIPEQADFRPMTEEDLQLFISAVLHEGFIAVDEQGTEAAAATAVVVSETSAPVTEPFHVDRPFLFVIHDAEHGTPLFLGRVDDPTR
jgi:serpin B